ncbi:hypothetical protein LCGC14_1858290 [marine sediment metagenome]|uniref:Uncharacterized protein n=1 Tax=marine sediment metagenome TaxID=412755 RepID=A0A0F9G8I5_9ZZZZ
MNPPIFQSKIPYWKDENRQRDIELMMQGQQDIWLREMRFVYLLINLLTNTFRGIQTNYWTRPAFAVEDESEQYLRIDEIPDLEEPTKHLEGDIGISFLMNLIEEISVLGTVINVTHITERAFNTDQDINDVCLHLEEIPNNMLGIDKYGNKTQTVALMSRRSCAKSISFQFARDSKTRQTEMSVSRNMISIIVATNEKIHDAIMRRFIYSEMNLISKTISWITLMKKIQKKKHLNSYASSSKTRLLSILIKRKIM